MYNKILKYNNQNATIIGNSGDGYVDLRFKDGYEIFMISDYNID